MKEWDGLIVLQLKFWDFTVWDLWARYTQLRLDWVDAPVFSELWKTFCNILLMWDTWILPWELFTIAVYESVIYRHVFVLVRWLYTNNNNKFKTCCLQNEYFDRRFSSTKIKSPSSMDMARQDVSLYFPQTIIFTIFPVPQQTHWQNGCDMCFSFNYSPIEMKQYLFFCMQ